jgi:BirA family biotin operon repressor/biotin-[acetyl-CoA-carboxylase] ligase
VLVETSGDLSLVGIGLNLTSAPLDGSTCVSQYVESVNRDEWVRVIVRKLIEMSETSFDLDAYRTACLTLGLHVRLEGVGHEAEVEGVATDVDDDGRLTVLTVDGEVVVSSGECLHVRAETRNS